MERRGDDERGNGADERKKDEDYVLPEPGSERFSTRKTWEVRSHMLDVAGNYPGHRKYEPSNWMCQACGGVVREDQEHLTRCEGYTDLRGDADLENEEELVEVILKVMNRRKEKNWE